MSQWTLKGGDVDGEAIEDNSGTSVALSADGNIMAIGSPFYQIAGDTLGQVRVYDWDGTDWIQKGLDINGEEIDDQSGWSVSLSSDGNTVAIGAPFNSGSGSYAGHTRVYEWDGAAWIQKGLDIDGEAANNKSGWSVSISSDGNTVAIGAPFNTDGGTASGHTRIYEWDGTTWIQKGLDLDGESVSDRSGWSVSMSDDGNTVIIGAHFNGGGPYLSGHARVYEWIAGSWSQKGLDLDGESLLDHSGWSVSINEDGNTIAIGAQLNNDGAPDAGQTRVYTWDGTAWVQKGLDIDGDDLNDQSGSSVALSADGNRIAVGAHYSDEGAFNAGQVKVYEWDGTSWIQDGMNINGEEIGDESGLAVAFSADGSTLAIGAPFNDGIAENAGHVRVYEPLCGAEPYETILSPITICHGDSVLIFDNYQSLAGFYNDTLTSILGCDSLDVQELIINNVEIGIANDGVDFVADAVGVGITYQWINCSDYSVIDGETDQTFTAIENGSYAVIVNDNSCIDTSDCITISDIGLNEFNTLSKVQIYPNPTKSLLNITVDNGTLLSIEIYNILGEQVYSQNVEGTNKVNIDQIEKGIYLLKINTTVGEFTKRIAIE